MTVHWYVQRLPRNLKFTPRLDSKLGKSQGSGPGLAGSAAGPFSREPRRPPPGERASHLCVSARAA